jgi:dCTP deaminase
MSMLSDKTIKSLSAVPKYLLQMEYKSSPTNSDVLITSNLNRLSNMSLEDLKYFSKNSFIKGIHHHLQYDVLRTSHYFDAAKVLSYVELAENEVALGLDKDQPMISPFVDHSVKTMLDSNNVEKKIISYGLDSAGYSVRLDNKFKLFKSETAHPWNIDPLDFSPDAVLNSTDDVLVLGPGEFVLGVTQETFNIPRDVKVLCIGKSTYARCGLFVNCTNIQPGFSGNVVLELFNGSSLPIKIYANQGIAEFSFIQLDQPCEVSYADKDGKYMNQQGVTTPIA